jgi:hypothetical protein
VDAFDENEPSVLGTDDASEATQQASVACIRCAVHEPSAFANARDRFVRNELASAAP